MATTVTPVTFKPELSIPGFKVESGFYDKAAVSLLKERNVPYIISAKLTQGLQQGVY